MEPRNGAHGRGMEQFQANLRALRHAARPGRDAPGAGSPAELAGVRVPYPENEIWAAAVRGWMAPHPPRAAEEAPARPRTEGVPGPEVHRGGEPPMPSAPERVDSCHGLQPGTPIEARGPRGVAFEGTVQEVVPALGLFWAVSANGQRRIIELDEYAVYAL